MGNRALKMGSLHWAVELLITLTTLADSFQDREFISLLCLGEGDSLCAMGPGVDKAGESRN